MLEEFPVKFNNSDKKVMRPAGIDLFKEDGSKKLGEQERELFHRTVAKCLFMAKRARPDIQTTVAVLCSQVQDPVGQVEFPTAEVSC